jgi:hypothetical protein
MTTARDVALLAMSAEERADLRARLDAIEGHLRESVRPKRARPAPVVRMPEQVSEGDVSRVREALRRQGIG